MKKGNKEAGDVSIWDCGSPLYDSFELASLAHIIERQMMVLPTYTATGASVQYFALPVGESRRSDSRGCAAEGEKKVGKRKMMIIWGRNEEKQEQEMTNGAGGFHRFFFRCLCFPKLGEKKRKEDMEFSID